MRLTKEQVRVAKAVSHKIFGESASLWLFGSMVYDEKRGGDYDFLIEGVTGDPTSMIQKRLDFLCSLQSTQEYEDERVDLVIEPNEKSEKLTIYRVAKQEGVLLWVPRKF